MAVIEESGLMKYKDKDNNVHILLPITTPENVEGLTELLDKAGKNVVELRVISTICENVELTDTNPSYALDAMTSLTDETLLLDYKYYYGDERDPESDIYGLATGGIWRWGSNATSNCVSFDGQTITDTWRVSGRNCKAVVSIYQVEKVIVNSAQYALESAEGFATDNSGSFSHAEGVGSVAKGMHSHAEGCYTEALGDNAHSEGFNTIAQGKYQHAQGKYNLADSSNKYAHIVGNGTSASKRANAHTVDWSGNAWYAGNVYAGGTSQDDADLLTTEADVKAALSTTVYAATSTDGVAYSVTVPGITALTAGYSFVMVPDKLSTSRSTTLNVNDLGAKNLRVHVSGNSGTTSAPNAANWLASGKPVRVTYDGMWWIADVTLPSANDLWGSVQAEDVEYSSEASGLAASNVQTAIDELAGAALQTQVMTTAEYNALATKEVNTLYMLSDGESEDSEAVQSHIADTDIHVTANDKSLWNQGMLVKRVTATLPTSAKWSSVTYGGGKFVAVASDTNIAAYSTDGINWTQTTMPMSAKWSSVTYGGGKFVAVASNSAIAGYSTDGVTWTQTTLPASGQWPSVAYGNGKFVAVRYNGIIAAYSTDGITWTQTTLPVSTYWVSVTYGNGKFVAVARTSGSTFAVYSTDGITWTQTTLPASGEWTSVAYGNGKFVAMKSFDYIAGYSTDGVTWTQTTLPASTYWSSVTYANGKFVAVTSSKNIAAYSTDGITWTQTTLPKDASWVGVTYGNGKFVAVSSSEYIVAYSTDGVNWSDRVLMIKTASGKNVTDDVKTALGVSENSGELEEHTHTVSEITDFPASMPASDVYSWAKASTKPTYTASEVGAATTSYVDSAIQSAINATWEASY